PSPWEVVRQLQLQYRAERDLAQESGVLGKFPPLLRQRAEQMARKADDALAGGRIMEARLAFQEARWLLPNVPPGFPEHVARVFGSSKLRHPSYVYALAYSPDGTRLATGDKDGFVKIWDVATGRELLTYRGHKDAVNAVAYSPDGKLIASAGDDRTVRLWEPATGKDKFTLAEHIDKVTSVAFHPDGKMLASGGADKIV